MIYDLKKYVYIYYNYILIIVIIHTNSITILIYEIKSSAPIQQELCNRMSKFQVDWLIIIKIVGILILQNSVNCVNIELGENQCERFRIFENYKK